MEVRETFQHVAHDGARRVDELLHGTSTALPTTARSSISLKAFTQSARSYRPATRAFSLPSPYQRIISCCAAITMARRLASAAASLGVGSLLPPQPFQ